MALFLGTSNSDPFRFGTPLDDVFRPGRGNDGFDGRGDVGLYGDRVEYWDLDQGVIVDLVAGQTTARDFTDSFSGIESAFGSNFNDEFVGNFRVNQFSGLSGNDVFRGLGEGDLAAGGLGNDTISFAGATNRVEMSLSALTGRSAAGSFTFGQIENLTGGEANDLLIGDNQPNLLIGGGGDDVLFGNGGTDVIRPGPGDDTVNGGNNAANAPDIIDYSDSASGVLIALNSGFAQNDAGRDSLVGIEGAIGSDFDDTFSGTGALNDFRGRDGNDSFFNLGANDRVFGDAGQDRVTFERSVIPITIDLAAGQGSSSNGAFTFFSIEDLTGGEVDDVLSGDENANRIEGRAGDDVLRGRSGDDVIAPGAGTDTVIGGGGVDVVTYASASSSVVIDLEAGSAETDGETDVLTGIESAIGSGQDDLFVGSDVANQFIGGAGDDQFLKLGAGDAIDGGDGFDFIGLGDLRDMVVVNMAIGVGAIAGEAFTIANIEALTGGRASDEIVGDAEDNILRGGDGADIIGGGEGDDDLVGGRKNDRLDGMVGDDRLEGGGGRDVLIGGAGDDRLNGASGDDRGNGGAGHDALIGGLGRDALNGGNGRDQLIGGAGKDSLRGGAGTDFIDGGRQNDVLRGDGGRDTFFFSGRSGQDTILDFKNNVDRIEIDGVSSFDDLTVRGDDDGAEIAWAKNSIFLEGVDQSLIGQEDFLFT